MQLVANRPRPLSSEQEMRFTAEPLSIPEQPLPTVLFNVDRAVPLVAAPVEAAIEWFAPAKAKGSDPRAPAEMPKHASPASCVARGGASATVAR